MPDTQQPPGEMPEPAGSGTPASKQNSRLLTGVAVGIGSAAIVAALLYANRSKRGD